MNQKDIKQTCLRLHRSAAGPVFYTHEALEADGVRHGFFTRKGGLSTGLYNSLNCGPGSSDEAAAVRANRARVAKAMGLTPDKMAGLYQIHSATCVSLTDAAHCAIRPEADAYATALKGAGLAILTADCLPVLFSDAQAGVIGAAHAGWRGAVAGVIDATVTAMQGLGADASRIVMVIGPGIARHSYQVSPDMKADIIALYPEAESCFTADAAAQEKYLFDLPGFARHRGTAAGLNQIYDSALDTYRDEALFFSHRRATHRREADSGRLISVITQT